MFRFLVTFALFTYSLSVFAKDWHEYTSENFVVYSDADPDDIKPRVADFEIYRQAALLFLGFENVPENKNAKVYIFKSGKEFQNYIDSEMIAGYYQYQLNGPVIVMPEKTSRSKKERAEEGNLVLFHEYIHYLLRERTGINYPRWYDEGLSDLLGAAKLADGKVGIGASNPWRHGAVAGSLRISVQRLIEKPGQGNWRQVAGFYPTSWMLTHYLLLGHLDGEPNYAPRLKSYLAAYAEGGTSVADFEKHMGITVAALDKALEAYAEKRYLKGYGIPVAPYSGTLKQRTLSSNEALYHKVNLLMDGDRASKAKSLLRESQKNQPFYAENISLMAVLEARTGTYDRSTTLIEEALQIGKDNVIVMTNATHALTLELDALKEKNQWNEALYQRAFDLGMKSYAHPDKTLEPARNLWELYALKGDELNTIKKMMEVYKETPSRIDLNMTIGHFLAQTSSYKLALPFLAKVIAFSHDDDLKEEAGELIESIQANKTGDAKK